MDKKFEIIDHTADVGVAAWGADIGEAFANMACGLFSLMVDIDCVDDAVCRRVELDAADREELLVAWLNELIYLFEVEGMLFKRFEIVELGDTGIKADCWGEGIDLGRHRFKREVKAATYHMVKIEPDGGGFRARVLFDI